MSDVEQWEHDEQRAMETEITTVHMDFSKVEIPKEFFETYFHQELANDKKV